MHRPSIALLVGALAVGWCHALRSPPVSTTLTKPAPEPEPAPEPAPTPEPLPRSVPGSEVHHEALTEIAHASVVAIRQIEHEGHTIVAYRYNTLEAHFGGLDNELRDRVLARFSAHRAACEAEREEALAEVANEWDRSTIERWVPCGVEAARIVRERPPPEQGSKGPERPPDNVSPQCDALAVARLDGDGEPVICVGHYDALPRRNFDQ